MRNRASIAVRKPETLNVTATATSVYIHFFVPNYLDTLPKIPLPHHVFPAVNEEANTK
jgi:hypothetical protein